MTWGYDSITSIKFNPIEMFILESCASNRNIELYDMKHASPLKGHLRYENKYNLLEPCGTLWKLSYLSCGQK